MHDPVPGVAAAQRRTLGVLFLTQVIGGVGVGIGASVGALLAADLTGVRLSGFSQSAAVIGAALLALPAAAIVNRYGRRPSLAAAYLLAALGSAAIVIAAMRSSIPLLLTGFLLFGGANAAGLQARFAAVDLAPSTRRARDLSIVIWATTIGAVAGPQLAALSGAALTGYGVPVLAAPFAISALLFATAAILLILTLRPDPAILARGSAMAAANVRGTSSPGMRVALDALLAHPSARLGVMAMAVGHFVMIGVMSMTPVHIRGAGHDATHTLRIVGVVLSLHIAGMFAFSPVVGWLTDRVGRRPVIVAGIALLLASSLMAGSAEHDEAWLALALTLLGLGWSCTMVAGSTLLTESISGDLRTSAQGLSDAIMGLAGASGGALSGVIVAAWGYPMLAMLAAIVTMPFIVPAVWPARAGHRG